MLFFVCLFLSWQEPAVQGPELFAKVWPSLTQLETADPGQLLVQVGSQFLGTPYVAATLDQSDQEQLVVCLDGMDCFTFMDQMLALSRTVQTKGDYATFCKQLEDIRYRDGRVDGYPSRLHYTCDWAFDTQRRGFLKDVSAEVGGVPYQKQIRFMTQHRSAYRGLANETNFVAMVQVEAEINRRSHCYVPEDQLRASESQIHEGDILAITTTNPELDVVHVGLATFRAGRLHLLHASSVNHKVEVMEQPLQEYLLGMEKRNGIMVFRPLAVGVSAKAADSP